MPKTVFKSSIRRQRLIDTANAALRASRSDVIAGMAAFFEPVRPEGAPALDVGPMLDAAAAMLGYLKELVLKSDADHRMEVSGDAVIRAHRDGLAAALGYKLRSLRWHCLSQYGERVLNLLALDDFPGRAPDEVWRHADIVRQHFLDPDLDLGEPLWKREGETAESPSEMVERLEPEYTELAETLEKIHQDRSDAGRLVIRKQAAIEEHDAQFFPLVRWLEATFRLAGEVEMAKRIRPSVRRLRGEEPIPEIDDPEGPEPGDETAPDESAPPQPSPNGPPPHANPRPPESDAVAP